ncbi:hypothetical protein CkaCkLH20_05136 [Colletotrichum karsti]|uniref:Uncharacterized protein n=1 Tax=Colletotrichum karsti TaxID=1095194 RepID=A0A9P6I942_9PEZI|nr:uncharacterized protein CkaCkLH20_05136 [Colletotrichum karsti]KAF9877436.1 hypothetical protein CkaCkLH20_05136 [Colletotrichum karsti]
MLLPHDHPTHAPTIRTLLQVPPSQITGPSVLRGPFSTNSTSISSPSSAPEPPCAAPPLPLPPPLLMLRRRRTYAAVASPTTTTATPTPIPAWAPLLSPLDSGSGVLIFFGFVNASNSPWNNRWAEDPYSTPIECYFTHPDSPYIAPVFRTSERHSFQSCDIYPISDRDFSEKLTQLLNTFWIVNIAPRSGIGNFTYGGPDSIDDVVLRQNATGTRTPDRIVTRTDIPWLIVLVVASLSMLSAGVAAAVLGALRRGPDVLDRATIFLRSNPNAELPQTSSMEDGIEQARRVKHVRVCVGDVKSQDDVGEVALGTVGNLIPLSWQKDGRVYS